WVTPTGSHYPSVPPVAWGGSIVVLVLLDRGVGLADHTLGGLGPQKVDVPVELPVQMVQQLLVGFDHPAGERLAEIAGRDVFEDAEQPLHVTSSKDERGDHVCPDFQGDLDGGVGPGPPRTALAGGVQTHGCLPRCWTNR